MINFLNIIGLMLEEQTENNSGNSWVLIVAIVALALLMVYSIISGKKRTAAYKQQLEENQKKFVVGAKIKTYAGVYGEIIAIREALDESKVATIKSGEGENAMTFEIDLNYILGIDEKDNKELFDEECNALMQKIKDEAQNEESNGDKKDKKENDDKKEE